MFRNKTIFYGEVLSTPRPTPKLEDHSLSAVRDCLFNMFAATLHTGGRSSIHKLRTLHAVMAGNEGNQSGMLRRVEKRFPYWFRESPIKVAVDTVWCRKFPHT
jgi:hypothetical protein